MMKKKCLPTKAEANLYVKLRKKGYSPKLAGDLIKKKSLARKLL